MMETITKQPEKDNFVTVVSVGSEPANLSIKCDSKNENNLNSDYITVLTIGNSEQESKQVIEKVLVYRLPGERLGFGLKFEGGTKANEFVKRLFIQSCAPDSPASRVQSSWGKLTEGDEVLEIDSIAVNTMTRIDCVRCLKDSNVVIKLLVRHLFDNINDSKTRSLEDLPQVVSAEKKRTPPPPPPVPPRKIPRKIYKNFLHKEVSVNNQEQKSYVVENTQPSVKKKFQSPRSSGRSTYSPNVPRRDRRFSDGSLGPPDAQVYIDLFSQESTQSLSESDDTGSSISTVVDRFGSCPTTTSSSIAGSLPSTPTSVQKHMDFSNLFNYDDEEISTISLNNNKNNIKFVPNGNMDRTGKMEEKSFSIGEDGIPLQPPSCFQDAPLSYGNEDMRITEGKPLDLIIDTKTESTNNIKSNNQNCLEENQKLLGKPPVPPRLKDLNHNQQLCIKEMHDENMNISINLPRLVDFVPKCSSKEIFEDSIDMIQEFLENERQDEKEEPIDEIDSSLISSNDIDLLSSKWSITSHLATIGEVEEENQETNKSSSIQIAPIVIVENIEMECINELQKESKREQKEVNDNMESFSSDSRQPPDGHEFPDYEEVKLGINRLNFQSNFIVEKRPPLKTYKSIECINLSQKKSSFNEFSNGKPTLTKTNSVSNSDLSSLSNTKEQFETNYDITLRKNGEITLHTRSQSLVDMSVLAKQKNDRWSLLAEQRRKGLSKLKGLVIPEQISENEPTVHPINIPEIISQTTTVVIENKIRVQTSGNCDYQEIAPVAFPLTSPPWTTNNISIPKYSPAFKRKGLQVYPVTKKECFANVVKKIENDECNQSDAPKSLESITSPTKSDCSFDYITNSYRMKYNNKNLDQICNKQTSKSNKDLGKSEDESDNDSAMSSSQSSYISKCSPPPSPTREVVDYDTNRNKFEQDMEGYANNLHCRLLKPASVEAINRKNILASAKCRSGRDLKAGSPVIQRKYEEYDNDEIKLVSNLTKLRKLSEKLETKIIEQQPKVEPPVTRVPKKINTTLNLSAKRRVFQDKTKSEPIKLTTHSFCRKAKSLSVTDLRKSFEKFSTSPSPVPQNVILTSKEVKKIKDNKMNDKFSEKICENKIPKKIQVTPSPSKLDTKKNKPREVFSDEETISLPTKTIVLCPEFFGGSVGITLAGGTDYETKDITVHKIRYGSVAYKDGKLKRGDRIVSINGKTTKNLTHAESVDLLKEPVPKFVLIVKDSKGGKPISQTNKSLNGLSSKSPLPVKNVTHVINLKKDGAGLGFSIEGGKDSPQGDLPLKIKKIFQGGAADKSGELDVGDELVFINEISLVNLSRIEVWSLMKKLPDGNVKIHIHR